MGFLSRLKRKHAGDECEIQVASTPQELERILRQAFGGGITETGIRIGTYDALQQPTLLAVAKVLAESIAQLPLRLYLVEEDGAQREPKRHTLKRMFRDGPNTFQTAYEWMETIVLNMVLAGEAYNFTVRNSQGQPVELLPLVSGSVSRETTDFRFQYHVSDHEGRISGVFGPSEILHFRGLSLDGLVGLNSMNLQKEALGLALASEKQTGRMFKNGSRLSGVLEHPGELDPTAADRLRERWEQLYSGTQNVGKTAVLEDGMKFNPISQTGEQAQLIEQRKYQRSEIAAMNRVPPHMIGDFSGGLKQNVEQQNLEFHTLTLLPWLRRIEQRLEKQLLSDREKAQYIIRFDTGGFLRGDTKTRYESYRIGITSGFLTRNEARRAEAKPPIDGLDEPLVPLNMVEEGEETDNGNTEGAEE